MIGLQLNFSEYLPARVVRMIPPEHAVINIGTVVILQGLVLLALVIRSLF